jgi:predicted Zn-dependent peptidase
MIFQGNDDMTQEERSRAMASLGAETNAATWHNKVMFYIDVPQENVIEASRIFQKSLFGRKNFDTAEFEKEKLVVLEEERGVRDNVDAMVANALHDYLCNGPISIPIGGLEETIKSITKEELEAFYLQHYKPSKLLLTITGPKDMDFGAVANIFGENTNRFLRTDKVSNEYAGRKGKRLLSSNMEQARVFMCYRAVPISSKKALTLNYVDQFFSSSMDSRLFQSLRQRHGLCYVVGAYLAFYEDIGWYVIVVKTSKENVNKCVKLINKEIDLLLDKGPTEEEMVRAKNKYISEIYSGIETSYGLNSALSLAEFNKLDDLETTLSRIKNMTAGKIKGVCRQIFDNKNKQTFTCLPESEE